MSETAPEAAPEPKDAAKEGAPKEKERTPPWEKEGAEFDAEKASKLFKSLQRERDQEREKLQQKLAEYEQRDMTEQQKLADRADRAEKALAEKEQALLRHRVGEAKGVKAELLHGKTEEEMSDYADELLAWRGGAPVSKPSFDTGDRGSAAPTDDFGQQLRRQLGRR